MNPKISFYKGQIYFGRFTPFTEMSDLAIGRIYGERSEHCRLFDRYKSLVFMSSFMS